ncbi:MAG TPA: ABC transporter permease [Terriglobales bacterium]|nr:ABC transporter permease [Terriglobales bacterium]
MRLRGAIWLPAALLVLWHLAFLCACFFAPYDPAEQDRDLPYTPPSHLQFRGPQGLHLRPYACVAGGTAAENQQSPCYPVHFFVHGWQYSFAGMQSSVHLFGVSAPGRISILGTDSYGRDMWSRLLYGGRISLAIGLLATLVSLLLAMLIGTVAGYYGKWTDELLTGGAELFLVIPWLYFLLALRAMLPLHLSAAATFLLVVGVIGSLGWARPMRLIRGVVLTARERNYVLAARGFGASDAYLLRRHIAPMTSGVLLTQAALLIPQFVAAEAALSFFGLGVGEPVPSWGNMLAVLQQYSVLVSYWWMLTPAIALVVTSVTYWWLAERLQRWLKSSSI